MPSDLLKYYRGYVVRVVTMAMRSTTKAMLPQACMHGLFSKDDSMEIRSRCELIDRKLNGLINSLRGIGERKRAIVASNLK